MKLLLDTHILLWWFLDAPELPPSFATTLDRLEREGTPLFVAAISLWEIAKLASLKRISLSISLDEWFSSLESDPLLEILPLTGAVALESTRLGESFHKDPADQIIAATARCHGLKLMTVDGRILESGAVACLPLGK
jgi:PIN domain nuclease of toxin-antitoxin system